MGTPETPLRRCLCPVTGSIPLAPGSVTTWRGPGRALSTSSSSCDADDAGGGDDEGVCLSELEATVGAFCPPSGFEGRVMVLLSTPRLLSRTMTSGSE